MSPEDEYYLLKLLLRSDAGMHYLPNKKFTLTTEPYEHYLAAILSPLALESEPPFAEPSLPQQIEVEIFLSRLLLKSEEGDEINFYVIENDFFAKGQFGKVYRSPVKITLDSVGQLKIIVTNNIAKQLTDIDKPEFHQNVLREYSHLQSVDKTARLIRHTGSLAEASYWLLMKEIKGVTLDKVDLNKAGLANKFKIALSALLALIHFHDPVDSDETHVHNDIKPVNIIVDDDYIAHLIDFGMATYEDETRPGGNLAYLAPEYDRNAPKAKKENDVHALGLILFQLFLEIDKPFRSLPKGRYQGLKSAYPVVTAKKEFQPVKVYRSRADQLMHRFNFSDKSQATRPVITGLNKEDARELFVLFKRMRDKDSDRRPAAIDVYHQMLAIACNVAEFEPSYFEAQGSLLSLRSQAQLEW